MGGGGEASTVPPPAVDVTVLVTWLVMVPAVTVETVEMVADGVVVPLPLAQPESNANAMDATRTALPRR